MSEASFVYELSRVEAEFPEDEILFDAIELEPTVTVSRGARRVQLDLGWSRWEIAVALEQAWRIRIDPERLGQDEVAPGQVTIATRWRELHRGLTLSSRLRQFDPDARLVTIRLDEQTAMAHVSARVHGDLIAVVVPLHGPSDRTWDTIDLLVDSIPRPVNRRRSGETLPEHGPD